MIRHHVTQGTGRIVVFSTQLDAECFSDRDLDVVDVIAVPYRLEHPVSKAKYEYVLNGFLAEVMIDSIDLPLFQDLQKIGIQFLRRSQVMTERLLENEASPMALFLTPEAVIHDLASNDGEQVRRQRHIIEIVLGNAAFLTKLVQQGL